MLVIRNEQRKVLRAHARERFDAWLLERVRARWPDRPVCADADALARLLDETVALAQRAGMVSATQIADYVDLVMLLGPGWRADPRVPWTDDVLRNDRLDGRAKLRVLMQIVRASALERVGPEWGHRV